MAGVVNQLSVFMRAIADYVTVGGFIITLIMLVLTRKKADKAKNAASNAESAAKEAAGSARESLKKNSLIVVMGECRMLCESMEEHIRNGNNGGAILRVGELVQNLTALSTYEFIKQNESNASRIDSVIGELQDIRIGLNEIEEQARKKLDKVRIFGILNGITKDMTKWIEELKFEG
jgi:hypothetical protein